MELVSSTLLSNGLVNINVGQDPNEQQFYIHSALVCKTSDYFKKALDGKWKESETRRFHLTDHTPEAFRLYIAWLYSKSVPSKFEVPKNYQQRWNHGGRFMLLVDSYVLGEYVQDLLFMNAVMDEFMEVADQFHQENYLRSSSRPGYISVDQVRHVCSRTTPLSKLREALVAIYVMRAGRNWEFEDTHGPLPVDFAVKIAAGMARERDLPIKKLAAKDYYEQKRE